MAALENVLAVVSSITVDGVSYLESTDEAVVGDIVRIDEEYDYLTEGGLYEVTRIDSSDDPQIVDNDDDEYDLCTTHFTVFKRSTTSASPTTAKRLTVGDYAKIVANIEDHDYEIGSIVKIVTDDHDGKPYIGEYKNGCTGNYFMPADAVMATQAEFDGVGPATNTDQYVHDGITYSKEKRVAAKDELISVIENRHMHGWVNGVIAKCIVADPDDRNKFESTAQFIPNNGDRDCGGGSAGTRTQWLDPTEYVVLVPAPTSTVETRVHDGITYNVVKRNVRDGDKFIVVTVNSAYKTIGNIYAITGIDSDGDPEVDDDGDVYGYVCEGDYAVLEPVETDSGDTIVHDGKTYIKVVRQAVKDDLVVITATTGHFIRVGEIVVARSYNDFFAKREQFRDGRSSDGTQWISASDAYRVLEPVETVQPSEPVTPVTAVIGDQIRITRYQCGAPVGTVVTVKTVSDNTVSYDYNGRFGLGASHKAYELVAKPSPTFNLDEFIQEKRKPKIGELVLVVAAVATNGKYANGDVITVTVVDGHGDPKINGQTTFYEEYVVLTPKTAPAPSRSGSFKAGDTATLRTPTPCTGGFYVGDTVTVADTAVDGRHVIEIRTSRGNIGYCDAEHLEAITVGRQVGDFKNGDIVIVTSSIGVVPVGTIGTVAELRGERFRVNTPAHVKGNWHSASSVKLVAPVESRVDLAVTA